MDGTLERCICWGKEKKMAGLDGNPTDIMKGSLQCAADRDHCE